MSLRLIRQQIDKVTYNKCCDTPPCLFADKLFDQGNTEKEFFRYFKQEN